MTERVESSPLDLSDSSPASRLRLAARDGERVGDAGAGAKAKPPKAPQQDASLDEAIATVLSSCLTLYRAHAAALRNGYAVDDVHQARVALRRLRAFLGLIKPAIPCPERAALAAGAKEVAAALGAARDWDVFCEGLHEEARALGKDEPGVYALLDAAERRRIEAQNAACAMIAGRAARAFEANLGDFLARRGWRAGAAEGLERAGSARAFAAQALARLHRLAQKRCAGLSDASAKDRHEARIAVKKVRYAADFFKELFPAGAARAYLRILAKAQERLGKSNDVQVAKRLWREVRSAAEAKEAGDAAEAIEAGKTQQNRRILRAARESGRLIGKLEPFWS